MAAWPRRDPWGNRLVLLDASKGMLVTDADGRIVGNAPAVPPEEAAQSLPHAATPGNTVLLVVDVTRSCADPRYENPARNIRFGRIRSMIPSLASFIGSFRRRTPYDAFASPELIEHLERARVRYVVVAGVFGDGCVLATICGGFS